MRATKLYEYCPKTKSKRSGVPLLSTRRRRCVWFFCNEYREVTEEKEYACDLVKLSKLPLYNKLSVKIGPLESNDWEGLTISPEWIPVMSSKFSAQLKFGILFLLGPLCEILAT